MKHTLTRTGNRPLTFEGELVAHESTQIVNGKDHSRWHEITLYRATSGKFVIHVAYRTQWQGELDYEDVETCLGIDGATDWLRYEYDPCEHLVGYPEGSQFWTKQAKLMDDLTERYRNAVSNILKDFPEEI
jgi:hypothetical protein